VEPKISAAIVTYNGGEKAIKACKCVVENTKKLPLDFYVIDNASSDGTAEAAEQLCGVKVLRQNKNLGFGAAHNKVLNEEMGKYHFVINPDISFSTDILSELAEFMENNPDIVMCCPKILNEDGSEQHLPKERPTAKRLFLGRLAPLGGVFKKIRTEYTWADRVTDTVSDVDFCTGCFFVIKSEVFKKLGGFDERFFMYQEDVDLTLRAKEYGRTVINPQIAVTHLWERESAKSIKYLLIHTKSAIKFLRKWRKRK